MKKLVLQHKDVGADHVLDCVEDGGMTGELVGPGEEQVHLVAHAAGQRRTGGALVRLQLVAVAARLGGDSTGSGK